MARLFLFRIALWANSFLARVLPRSFVSASLGLRSRVFSFSRFHAGSFLFRSLVFRSLAFSLVPFCFARFALVRFSFSRFHGRSFLFRSLCARLFFVRSLSRSLVSVLVALRLLVWRSFRFARTSTPLCAPVLVHLDVYLYVCLFLSSAR